MTNQSTDFPAPRFNPPLGKGANPLDGLKVALEAGQGPSRPIPSKNPNALIELNSLGKKL